MRPYYHPVAAGFAHSLDHQILQVVQRVLQIVRAAAEARVDVLQYRFLAQIVARHVGDVGVNAFVVRHARPRRVRQRHVAAPMGVQKPRHAQQRIGAERQRVYEVVIDAPVDYVHAPDAVGRPHVNEPVPREQVSALHQLRADFARQKHVLVERGVIDARRQQRDGRIRALSRRELSQRLQKRLPVALHLAHAGRSVNAAQVGFGRLAVGYHI